MMEVAFPLCVAILIAWKSSDVDLLFLVAVINLVPISTNLRPSGPHALRVSLAIGCTMNFASKDLYLACLSLSAFSAAFPSCL